jgi:beta-lactamase class A
LSVVSWSREQLTTDNGQLTSVFDQENLSKTTLFICGFYLLFSLFLVTPLPAQNAHDLQQRIAVQMQKFGAESVGIYFEGPAGKTFTVHPDEIFHAASTMKVPVMMEVFRQVESGRLKLDLRIPVKNDFASIMDGSHYSLTPEDDEDKELYQEIGKSMPLRVLMERMINVSSNLATNLIIELVSATSVMNLMKEIGAKDMNVLRGVEDIKAYEAGRNNTTSARALASCFQAILDSQRFREDSRRQMLDILLTQKFTDGIPAGVRARERGFRVANKTGEITEIYHDAAIIQTPESQNYILVILTRGVKQDEEGPRLIAAIAHEVWDTLVAGR